MTVIKNNLIAFAIHICICFVLMLPVGFVMEIGFSSIILVWISVGACIFVAISLYLWAGRKYLSNTNGVMTNIASVLAIAIIIFVVTYAAFDSGWERLLRIPFYPLGGLLLYILDKPYNTFGGEEWKNVFLLMSIFPSITLWIGMVSDRAKILMDKAWGFLRVFKGKNHLCGRE